MPVPELRIGDEVWMRGARDDIGRYPVVGFGHSQVNGCDRSGQPYVAWLDSGCDGDYSKNPDNYVTKSTARARKRM